MIITIEKVDNGYLLELENVDETYSGIAIGKMVYLTKEDLLEGVERILKEN